MIAKSLYFNKDGSELSGHPHRSHRSKKGRTKSMQNSAKHIIFKQKLQTLKEQELNVIYD